MRNLSLVCLVGLLWAALTLPSRGADDGRPEGMTYKATGIGAITRLGMDLQKALPPKYKDIVHSQPVFIETDMMPFIKLTEYPDEAKPLRAVFISVGFIDLMNQVAHAKAIDKIEKKYFENFVVSLSKQTGEKELIELPNLSDKRFWTDDMMNEQLSSFNQVVGMVIAIKLSHHYLGHYKKYADKLTANPDAQQPAIESLLTPDEWEESVKEGARNAMETGLFTEGIRALYEAIGKMPKRPTWTQYFLPETVKVDKLNKNLKRYEEVYLKGGKF